MIVPPLWALLATRNVLRSVDRRAGPRVVACKSRTASVSITSTKRSALKPSGYRVKCPLDSVVPGEQSAGVVQQVTIVAKRDDQLFDGDLREAAEPLAVTCDAFLVVQTCC
jgi:hypothetical protein